MQPSRSWERPFEKKCRSLSILLHFLRQNAIFIYILYNQICIIQNYPEKDLKLLFIDGKQREI